MVKINNSWKSVLLWSSISTIVFFILSLFINRHSGQNNVKELTTLIGALFVGSLLVISILRMIILEVKDFLAASKKGKIVMIILLILVLGYVVPEAISFFKS